MLSSVEINKILTKIYSDFKVNDDVEITLEANPDDLTEDKIIELSNTKINRLSIGIQSFYTDDLKLMNRAHNNLEAENCLMLATKYFKNITVDLIYGIPEMSNQKWKNNINKALSFGVNHISCYALTVEPKTALEKLIEKGKINQVKDEVAEEHFHILVDELTKNNFIHYELSNFGIEGYFSKHNTSYWLGKHYIGIGPSAHSFNGKQRSWNVANNTKYIKSLNDDVLPQEIENLTPKNIFNEYIMTGLRTIYGVSLQKIETDFDLDIKQNLLKNAQKFIDKNLLIIKKNHLFTTKKGKFLCDGIASDLFEV